MKKQDWKQEKENLETLYEGVLRGAGTAVGVTGATGAGGLAGAALGGKIGGLGGMAAGAGLGALAGGIAGHQAFKDKNKQPTNEDIINEFCEGTLMEAMASDDVPIEEAHCNFVSEAAKCALRAGQLTEGDVEQDLLEYGSVIAEMANHYNEGVLGKVAGTAGGGMLGKVAGAGIADTIAPGSGAIGGALGAALGGAAGYKAAATPGA